MNWRMIQSSFSPVSVAPCRELEIVWHTGHFFLSQTKNQSQPNDFSFGAENIFFVRTSSGHSPRVGWKCSWKRCGDALPRLVFTLFGSFHWPKKDWQIVLWILFYAYIPSFVSADAVPFRCVLWKAEVLDGWQIVHSPISENRIFPCASGLRNK